MSRCSGGLRHPRTAEWEARSSAACLGTATLLPSPDGKMLVLRRYFPQRYNRLRVYNARGELMADINALK